MYDKGIYQRIQYINRFNFNKEKEGLWITFYADVIDRKANHWEGIYKNNMKNGYFREYDRLGRQLSTVKYVNDSIIDNPEELMMTDIVRSYYPDASVEWERSYLRDIPNGTWKKFDTSGAVVRTEIYTSGVKTAEGIIDAQGKRKGHWKFFYLDGSLHSEGNYKYGALFGTWKYYFPNSKLEQTGRYSKGGKFDGEWVWSYIDGSVRRVENYFNGAEDGESIEYAEDGEIIEQGSYIEGYKDGLWSNFTGDYFESGIYVDGMKHGKWEGIYQSTGKIAFKGNYIEDQRNDRHIFYYPNGRKKLEGNYQLGVKVGNWIRYNPEGVRILIIEYVDGDVNKISGKRIIGASR